MEKHKCKLCFKNFSNGRALGGHVRSHMMNAPIPAKSEYALPPPPVQSRALAAASHISDEVESASYSSEEDCGKGEKGLSNGRRENPKRCIGTVDPEFAFAVDAGSVVLQDRESETESSKNPTRRRSKRIRKSVTEEEDRLRHQRKKNQLNPMKKFRNLMNSSKTESWAAEPEPASSVSDATTEEDVAFCLMMLSRDKWKRQKDQVRQEHYYDLDDDDDEQDDKEEEEEAERSFEESDESEELKSTKARVRAKYKCETCNKVFRSYQALGGHRASHKKIKICTRTIQELEQENAAGTSSPMAAEKKIHQCPVCFRIFSSGQALGGHKRTHVIGASASTPVKNSAKFGDNSIDLNLPAPVDDDDDDISQIELSAVSDA